MDPYISIEKTDETIIRYIQQYMRPSIVDYDGSTKNVPLVYNGAQKWVQIRRRRYLVDQNGNTLYPLISFSRTGTKRNQDKIVNRIQTMGGYRSFMQIQNKYSKKRPFNTIDAMDGNLNKPSYYKLMLPISMICDYQFQIFTDSHEQMNQLLQGFFLHDRRWWIVDGYRVKVNFGDFTNVTQIQANTQRLIKSTFSLQTRSTLYPKSFQTTSTIQQVQAHKKINIKMGLDSN